MKKIVFTLTALMSLSTLTKAQVTSPAWDWPASNSYCFFGTNTLSQTASGNYALLQAKSGTGNPGRTYLNSPDLIHFRINNADKMTLANNGFVGIGTVTPNALLDVNSTNMTPGGVSVALARLTEGNTTGGGTLLGVRVWHTQSQDGQPGYAGTTRSFSIGHYFYGNENGSINFFRGGNTNDGSIGFSVKGFEAMRITSDGNVGIGTRLITNNPNNYKLAVNGTIGAKAVKVEVSSTTWSDYVFEKDYKLKTLNELESYVKTNKHLPNVPSACEVEENGIDIANMDATLLAKIEELTLYIIEQNKRIEVLENAAKN